MALLLPSSQRAKPRHPASDTLRLSDPHQLYWCDGLGYVLKSLLENAGYSQKAQFDILQHFAVLVAPFLGRAPAPGSPQWPSFMTDDHTPVEFSWDFHTGEKQPTVRYSFEPIALDAATISNPNNAGAAVNFKKALLKSFPSTDTLWFDHFEAYFTLETGEDISSRSDATPVFWAFDLTEKGASAKAYFFPGPVAQATNRTNLETISAAIASAPRFQASNFPSLEPYSQYAYESSKYAHELDMLAIDLEAPNQARLKIYFRDRRTSFDSVRENMSLGGRLSGIKFENGMRNLRKLWDALFDTTGVSEYAHLPHNEHRTAGILYNVEFRVHKTNPLVKIYIPVRHYSQSDEQVSRALEWYVGEEVAQRRDLSMAAVSAKLYRRCIKQAFKTELLQGSLGVHTYIGCSIQEGGELRVVAYMNPQEPKISK